MSTAPMTRRDRDDLAKVCRMRARVAKADVARREAELLADVEAKLSARYKSNDPRWATVTAAAKEAVAEADAQVAAVCVEMGIPEEFRPSLGIGWSNRGENAIAERRTELRLAAKARIAELGQTAKHEIARAEAETLTALLAGGLESDEARAFLEAMPTPEQLMSPLGLEEIGELDGTRLDATDRRELERARRTARWGS